MCGIAGILHYHRERTVDREILKSMTNIIAHRGPDGEGFYVDGCVGLGHRRLSIIDLETGDQPMFSWDKSQVLVFNGEIYNYKELRAELISHGYEFHTTSDTEVILIAYQHWGFSCQEKFNGMWAFAIWDSRKQLLFISRDRLGEKPLVYMEWDNSFLFASEIKSLKCYTQELKPDYQMLEFYLGLNFVPAPFTFYQGVKKLLPGHCLLIQDGTVEQIKYWDLPQINKSDLYREPDIVHREFENLFQDSVRLRMRSDVSFGAFLSGGLDSGTVVSVMAQYSELPVETFTIGFEDERYDERDLARAVATQYHTNHHEKVISLEHIDNYLDKIVFHYDEPFGDAAALPTGYMSQYAREHVKMVLTGDGGDEVLAGYTAFKGETFVGQYQILPMGLRKLISNVTGAVTQGFKGKARYKLNRINSVLSLANQPFEQRFILKSARINPFSMRDLVPNPTDMVQDFYSDLVNQCNLSDPYHKLQYVMLKSSLPDQMLVKVDKISMAHSLETRIPFLDHRIVELLYCTDKKVQLPNYQSKAVLKHTLATRLPNEVLNAPKRGFGVPLRDWFKDDSFDHYLGSLLEKDLGLDHQILQRIIKENLQGKGDYGDFIWRVMIYEKWLEKQ